MDRMSRTIPPTPVAAPWYGSTADGWECDSSLNTAASPSPRSTTPASSPGPTRTAGPSVGSFFRWTLLDLYEQCSDHMTEYMASSVRFGSRPRDSQTLAYSSSVSPRARWRASVVLTCSGPHERLFEQGRQQRLAADRAGVGVDGV